MGLANHDLPPPPAGKYPAKAHARRVAESIAQDGGPKEGIIYLEAQKTAMVEVCGCSYLRFSLSDGQKHSSSVCWSCARKQREDMAFVRSLLLIIWNIG